MGKAKEIEIKRRKIIPKFTKLNCNFNTFKTLAKRIEI